MVSVAGGIALAVVILFLFAVVGWFVWVQLQARRLGLPPPTLKDYLPWKHRDGPYAPPRPATGGAIGWFNNAVRKFKNRNNNNNRSAAGAYEPSQQPPGGGRRGFGALDPDEAWDARVNTEADSYGYYEGPGRDSGGQYGREDESFAMNQAGPYGRDEEEGRGRKIAPLGSRNPFDDDAEASLRGVSPRPMDGGAPRESHDVHSERRSAFREAV